MKALTKTVVLTNEFLDESEELSVTVEHYCDCFDIELSRDGDSMTISLEQLREALVHAELMVKQYETEEPTEQ